MIPRPEDIKVGDRIGYRGFDGDTWGTVTRISGGVEDHKCLCYWSDCWDSMPLFRQETFLSYTQIEFYKGQISCSICHNLYLLENDYLCEKCRKNHYE
jgi:hypothetical protein